MAFPTEEQIAQARLRFHEGSRPRVTALPAYDEPFVELVSRVLTALDGLADSRQARKALTRFIEDLDDSADSVRTSNVH